MKDYDYFLYIPVISIWGFFSYITYQNLITNKDIEYSFSEAILISVLVPVGVTIICSFVSFCLYAYGSIGVSCFEKIGTDESWDLAETIWFFSMFLED